MRILFLFLNLFFAAVCNGQSTAQQQHQIDSIVSYIDLDKAQVSSSFSLPNLAAAYHYTRYSYLSKKGSISKISKRFGSHQQSILQVFYFRNDELIYSTETGSTYFLTSGKSDSSSWNDSYYFSKGKLIDAVTHDDRKAIPERWSPEVDVKANAISAQNAVKRQLKKQVVRSS